MSRKDWSAYLEYDETSPSCLRWKVEILVNGRPLTKPGDVAGSVNGGTGYWMVGLDYRQYAGHRIVYEMMVEDIPRGMVVDHVNGIRTDNRKENLRVVSRRVNQRNQKKAATNTSGVTGVQYSETNDNRNGRWLAKWVDENGVPHAKNFSVKKCGGSENAFKLACEWRAEKIEECNSRGAGYSDRHGKEEKQGEVFCQE